MSCDPGKLQEIFSHQKWSDIPLASVAQWIRGWLVNQKITGSIPNQGTCLGCGPGPQVRVCRRQLINVSLSPSLPLSLKIHKIFFKKEWSYINFLRQESRWYILGNFNKSSNKRFPSHWMGQQKNSLTKYPTSQVFELIHLMSVA